MTSQNANERFEKFITQNLDLFKNLDDKKIEADVKFFRLPQKALGFVRNRNFYIYQSRFLNLLLFNFSIVDLIEIIQKQIEIEIVEVVENKKFKFIKLNFLNFEDYLIFVEELEAKLNE